MIMLLVLIRNSSNERETRGSLAVDGVPYCDTIEPPIIGNKTHPKGAIPRGWYRVDVTCSGKFKRPMPILRMVPGFEGIRIHAGLKVENTNGCICVGERWKENHLTEMLIKAQENHEEIYICVTDRDHIDAELPKREDPYGKCIGY